MNYKKIYEDLIKKAKSENRKKLKREDSNYFYYECHHILPKCLGGTNDKDNLVLLTAREHLICHRLLIEFNPKVYGLILGYLMMITIKNGSLKGREGLIVSSREYERIRIQVGELFSKKLKGVKKPIGFGVKISKRMLGDNNPSRKYGVSNKGIPWSEEVRAKISKVHKENKKFIGERNPKFIPIAENIFNNIIIDLENGYGGVQEIANYYSINPQRLFRHLYYKYIIFFDDLPNYLKKYIIVRD